jgi:hypothetical protein
MRSTILRLEGHIPFQNKASFHEGKIVFKVNYRDINIKTLKKVSPKSQVLKPTVISTNHPPFHPPGHPFHPPFVQTIKTVSQNGTAADHNAVSSPANIDSSITSPPLPQEHRKSYQNGIAADHNAISFPANQIDQSQAAALKTWESANHVTSSKQPKNPSPKRQWKSFATEVEFHNIFEQTQKLNLDRATQRPRKQPKSEMKNMLQ